MSDPRYKALGEPPIVAFVVEDDAKPQQFLRPADKVVTGGLGTRGTPKANYYAYGYRRMWKALLRAGERVPRGRVQRLIPAHSIEGAERTGQAVAHHQT